MRAHDFTDLVLIKPVSVLGRDHDGRRSDRFVVFILERHLAF